MCRAKDKTVAAINENAVMLGGVQLQQVTYTDQWTTTLGLNGRQMIFKIDTGAEVTVIPASSYNPVKDGPLHSPTRTLYGPSQQKLKVKGQFTGNLKKGDIEVREEMYVVQGLRQPLVECPAIAALNLVTRIESVASETTEL